MHSGPIYDKLSNALRRYCSDFEQPTHWSSIVRKAKTRLNKGKDLEEPIFSKGKVSDIGPSETLPLLKIGSSRSFPLLSLVFAFRTMLDQ
jgi:hypothetical protein